MAGGLWTFSRSMLSTMVGVDEIGKQPSNLFINIASFGFLVAHLQGLHCNLNIETLYITYWLPCIMSTYIYFHWECVLKLSVDFSE